MNEPCDWNESHDDDDDDESFIDDDYEIVTVTNEEEDVVDDSCYNVIMDVAGRPQRFVERVRILQLVLLGVRFLENDAGLDTSCLDRRKLRYIKEIPDFKQEKDILDIIHLFQLVKLERLQSIISRAVMASSVDHSEQDISETLNNNLGFWSSKGSHSFSLNNNNSSGSDIDSQQEPIFDADEYLIYELASPLQRVCCVAISVYRADFQAGSPLYPPSQVSFDIVSSLENLKPLSDSTSPKYPVAATTVEQFFFLNDCQRNIGKYLRINLHGKRQLQLEDMKYYTCIRFVRAIGDSLPFDEIISFSPSSLSKYHSWESEFNEDGPLPIIPI